MDDMRTLLNLMESFVEEDSYARHGDPDEPESYLGGEKFVGEHEIFDIFDKKPMQVSPNEYVFSGHDGEEYAIVFDGDDFQVINSDGLLVVDNTRFANPVQALKNRIYGG